MTERDFRARQQPGNADTDREADRHRERPDQQRVAEGRQKSRPLKRVDPVTDAPRSRLDEPIVSRVETVDQKQDHRPDKKIAEA